jgi:hypothetical protein
MRTRGTIKTHVGHIFAKLDLRDRSAAVVFAFDHGWCSRAGAELPLSHTARPRVRTTCARTAPASLADVASDPPGRLRRRAGTDPDLLLLLPGAAASVPTRSSRVTGHPVTGHPGD